MVHFHTIHYTLGTLCRAFTRAFKLVDSERITDTVFRSAWCAAVVDRAMPFVATDALSSACGYVRRYQQQPQQRRIDLTYGPSSVALVSALLSHCCRTVVALLSHCCRTVVAPARTVVALLSHCCRTVVALLSHCRRTVVGADHQSRRWRWRCCCGEPTSDDRSNPHFRPPRTPRVSTRCCATLQRPQLQAS
jgi:hypothetical protein